MVEFRVSRGALSDPNDAEQVWWDVISRAFDELSTPYELDPRLADLSPGQRALYALHWTRSEVDNGGFHQYLWNDTGMLLSEAVLGADLIGAAEFAELFREVLAVFPQGRLLEDRDDRIQFLEHLSELERTKLEQLDHRFYELMGYERESKTSPLASHCAAYVGSHPNEFFLPRPELEP